MIKERNKMINRISSVVNSKDIEIIISDFLNNNPIEIIHFIMMKKIIILLNLFYIFTNNIISLMIQ